MALSNSAINTLRSAPYYDDYFSASETEPGKLRGEEFDFHRILFRPRFPVQSRELTQIQTLLQAQLERLGKASFKDGENVLGGQLTLDTTATSGQVTLSTNLVAFFARANNTGKYVFETGDETKKAYVLQYVSADEGETSNNYLVFKHQTGSTFLPGAVVQDATDATVTATFQSGTTADIFHDASVISIDEGIFFISGFFVRVRPQTIVLSAFSALPSFRVGLEINEEVLDEQDDIVGASLLDPTNNAPGAHRFRISLVLAKRPIETTGQGNFIELARIINGEVHYIKKTPKFVRLDELNQILARRTFDEAGDYIVKTFTPVIETNPNDESTFILSLGPGKAYVRGYEVETTQPTKKVVRKGRATNSANNRSIPTTVGNFVYATRVAATSPVNYFANTATVDILCANISSINVASSAEYNKAKIGTAKVRMLETFSVPSNPALFANNSVYKLFFYDTRFDVVTGNVSSAAVTNNAIELTLASANGVPAITGALVGATLVIGGAQSPISGTYTVNNYTASGTNAVVQLKEFLPTLPNANSTYRFLFQTKDVDAFALFDGAVGATQVPYKANLSFQAEVSEYSKLGGNPTGVTFVTATNDNVLLYQIPEQFVKANSITSNSAIFTSWLKTTSNSAAMSNVANVAVSVTLSGNNFALTTGNLSATTARQNFVIFDQTADANGHGQIIQFVDTPQSGVRCAANVSVSALGQTYTLSFTYYNGSQITSTRSFVALARTTVNGLAPREKTLVVGNTTAVLSGTTGALNAGQIEFHSLNVSSGFTYSLKTADVLSIRKILYKEANTSFANTDLTTATDVTSYFTLDTGQRDNSYEYSTITPKTNASSVVRPTGRLLVIFDWFRHSGRGYVSVDSYLTNQNVANGLSYDEIPDYKSARYARTVNLRSVLDFRPVRSNYDFTNVSLVYAANDTNANNTYLTSDGNSYLIPVSDDVWMGSYQYYLSRIDKIGVAFDGTFKIFEGQDAVVPVAPTDDSGSLLLFQLSIPPYTLVDDAGVPTQVTLKTFDHKRYTMRDLSKLDDRVSQLEYYTALNSLEQITSKQTILDADDNERFKNGILVDSFMGHTVADVSRPDFTASIDSMQHELRTAFRTFVMQFSPDNKYSTSYNVKLIGDMAIPVYGIDTFISQPLATRAISVNPFDVASFYGTLKMSPSVDIWKDVTQRPAQVIDIGGTSDSWIGSLPSFTNWGEWEQTWSGVTAVQPRTEYFAPEGWTPEVHDPLSMLENSWNEIETTTNYQRQGTQYEFTSTKVNQSIGNQILDISVVHHMRGRDVVFAADGLKPNANLYPFFDGTSVLPYVQKANILQLIDQPLTATPFYIGQTLYVRKAISGTVTVNSGSAVIAGTNTKFSFELVPGQLVRVTQGVNTFDASISTITSNTSATLTTNSPQNLAAATLYTLTPVTVADVARRITGNTVQYTVKVVRAIRDADTDDVVPYAILPGSLRPEKHVNDAANTTYGATVLIPPGPRAGNTTQSINVSSAIITSGVVRSYDGPSAALRLDNDMGALANGTTIYFVSGAGAGTSANVVSYNTATQTATVDTSQLAVNGTTIYSIGQPVSDGFIANNSITSGRAGTIAGCLHLPNAQFAVGTRLFRVSDSPTNNVQTATTSAEESYTASGVSYTQQAVSISSREIGLRTRQVTDNRSETTQTTAGFKQQYIDPLAETFLVDGKLYPQGIFLTSVDVCFASKPTDDIPVIVELRPVVNGYPSSNQILPAVSSEGLATVSLRPDEVNTTATPDLDDSTKRTRFEFPAPINLLPGEYAIVVRSDSNLYTVYTAELGATVIGSNAKVAKQPYAGSFFKSQNASTWTESPFEDLMFRLNRATWAASPASPNTAVLVARAVPPAANATFDSFEFYPHEVQFAEQTAISYALDMLPLNEATQDVTGSIAARYNVIPNAWTPLVARSMVQGGIVRNPFSGTGSLTAANTVDAMITFTTTSPDVAPYVDLKKLNILCVRHLINDMGLTNTNVILQNPGAGYLAAQSAGTVATTSNSPTITGTGTNFVTALAAGDTLVVGGNVEVRVSSVTNATSLEATSNVGVTRSANSYHTYGTLGGNNAVVLTISGNGTDAAGYATVGRNGKLSGVVFSANGAGYTGNVTLTVPASTVVLDASLHVNAALQYNSELMPADGNGLTRYITRAVTLADGFDARDIRVYFDAYRPTGTKFYVYYKVLPGDSTGRFEDQSWRLMTQETPDTTVSTNYKQFKEFVFKTPNDRALDQSTDTTDRFKVFAVKLVMATQNPVNAPRVANFRAIALDT